MSAPVPAAVLDDVRRRLAGSAGDLTPHRVAEALRASGSPVGDATVLAVHDLLRRDVLGAGPLEELLRLPDVTDVLVNGPEDVWIDRGAGLERVPVRFPDDAAVRRLAQRLAASAGRRLDDATPHADVRLPDGTRFHAVLAPVARSGTALSLRVPRGRVWSLPELVTAGALPPDGAFLLEEVVDSRCAFLVTGGTGSGKTSVLSALLSLVDPGERIVLVEDASELQPDHPHVVALEGRPPNIEGAGAISLQTLVRQALRMRPDRLVVGEVRGGRRVSRAVRETLPSRRDTAAPGETLRRSKQDTAVAARDLVGTLDGPGELEGLRHLVGVCCAATAAGHGDLRKPQVAVPFSRGVMTEMNVLERIRAKMTERNVKQNDLAATLGVSEAVVSRLLNGERKLSAAELGAIADRLRTTTGYLLGRTTADVRPFAVAARLGSTEHAAELDPVFARARTLLELRGVLGRLVESPAREAAVEVRRPSTSMYKLAGDQTG